MKWYVTLRESGRPGRGGSRKLFWEGHIGLESPKTTRRDAEGVEEKHQGRGFPPPQPTKGLGERRKLPQRGLGRS